MYVVRNLAEVFALGQSRLQEAVQTLFARQRIRKAWRIFKTKGERLLRLWECRASRPSIISDIAEKLLYEPMKHSFLVFRSGSSDLRE
jgi:hypothetical protein